MYRRINLVTGKHRPLIGLPPLCNQLYHILISALFQRKDIYAPQIIYLHCGGSSNMPVDVWYHHSYGTIAIYKRDWESFGGISEEVLNKDR